MSEVYLAEDTRLGRKVAIKFPSAELTDDPRTKKRLVKEAHAAAALDHPNICMIYEVGEEAGHTFIVMQYVEGETLAAHTLRRPFEPEEALEIAAQVAAALTDAHAHGLIHRDIKPQNVMLDLRRHVKVLDFGLAKFFEPLRTVSNTAQTESLLSEPGLLIGTIPYMSPEQLRREDLDARSDIFSFGVTLYELLSGKQPFLRESVAATISSILTNPPLPLSRFVSDVSPEFERIVYKCIEKDKNRRYQSARELTIDLNRLQRWMTASDPLISTISLPSAQTPRNQARQQRSHRLNWILISLLAAIAFLFALYHFSSPYKYESSPIVSLAVLPLSNVNSDAKTEYLSEGLTDSLINRLSQLPNLKVIGRTSVSRYKGSEIDPHAVGRALQVQALLTGRVLEFGDDLTISVDLINAEDNRHIWGKRITRKTADVLAVQDQIAHELTEQLRVKLSGEDQKRISKRETDDVEAYRLYITGRFFWNKRTSEGIRKAIDCFNQAIALDPNYALAYAGLADSYLLQTFYGGAGLNESYEHAKRAAQRATALDDALTEAHTALGNVYFWYDWNWDEAQKEFARAIALNRNNAMAHYAYSHYLLTMGRFDEALVEAKDARELDPLSLLINSHLARVFYYAGQYDQAIEQCQKTIEIDASFPLVYAIRGSAQLQRGKYEDALKDHLKAADLARDEMFSAPDMGYIYGRMGKADKATEIIAKLDAKSRSDYIDPYDLAVIYTGLGKNGEAIAWLDKAYRQKSPGIVSMKIDPMLNGLREEAKFKDLLKELGLS